MHGGGAYATEMLTYDHRPARKLCHCGVTPLWCRHTTTGVHGSCTTVALHRYGADIRPHARMDTAPLWRYIAIVQIYDHRHAWKLRHCGVTPLRRYTAIVQTYDHRHAWKLRHCGVTPLWCRHTTTGMHEGCATVALCRCGAEIGL